MFQVANVMWYYAISKAIELLDTVLMILRKKDAQVTFLHVFHHATMLNIWWWVPTFIPGGQSKFIIYYYFNPLTLLLLEPKVISLCLLVCL